MKTENQLILEKVTSLEAMFSAFLTRPSRQSQKEARERRMAEKKLQVLSGGKYKPKNKLT